MTTGRPARRTPARMLLVVVGSIFLAEIFVMAVLALLPPLPPLAGAVLDAGLVTLLADMVDLFQACRSTEEAYAVIVRSAGRLFPESAGVLYVFKASRNLVEPVVSWGGAPHPAEPFHPEQCWALRRGRPYLASSAMVCSHLGGEGPAAELCLPMMAQGETLGVLLLRSDAPGEALHGSLRLASAAAEHIGLALANLRLRETLPAQAIRDPLTGLFNRRYLEETQEREIKRAERRRSTVGVVMLPVVAA